MKDKLLNKIRHYSANVKMNYARTILFIITVLGFSSGISSFGNNQPDDKKPRPLYGVTAQPLYGVRPNLTPRNFILRGIVLSEKQDQIRNIKVTLKKASKLIGTTRTNLNGEFILRLSQRSDITENYKVLLKDTDGKKNGWFAQKDTLISITPETPDTININFNLKSRSK